jgi:hypothetical protein
MPNERSEDVFARDLVAAAEGQVRGALTLINDAARRVRNVRPHVEAELAALGVQVIHVIRRLHAEAAATSRTTKKAKHLTTLPDGREVDPEVEVAALDGEPPTPGDDGPVATGDRGDGSGLAF